MKKLFVLLFSLILLASCANKPTETSASIDVYTRDASSGTREAFESGIGLDELSNTAVETSGNGDMASKVGSDEKAIGYVSLTTDFDANNLKPIHYEGVEPTIENVLDGSYALSRPFAYVTRESGDFVNEETEQVVVAFIDFILNSEEGLQAVESAGGIVDISNAKPWRELASNHDVLEGDLSDVTIRTGGSTSVEKTLQAALEAFQAQTGVDFTMNHTGSGDGFKRVLGDEKDSANQADIGFASRHFKTDGSEDVAGGMDSGVYCLDAVVVVVSKDNTAGIDSLTQDQLVSIFNGETTDWASLAQ